MRGCGIEGGETVKRISLRREVDLVRAAIRAVITLTADLVDVRMCQHGLPAEQLRAPLILAEVRLGQLDDAMRGGLDPEALWSDSTSAPCGSDHEHDRTIISWTDKHRTRHHKRELRRLQLLAKWRKRKRSRGASR